MSPIGKWINEFGSIMTITSAENGVLSGTYGSHTGATGNYTVVGAYDTQPDGISQTLAFAISWRDNSAPYDPSFHWVSAFSGQLQSINGTPTITTTYLLQKNTTSSTNWESTIVATATFVPYTSEYPVVPEEKALQAGTTPCVGFKLTKGQLTDNGATPWFAMLPIGTPQQHLKVMVDTGTTHTWVTSDLCNTDACNLHNKFNPQASTSFTLIDKGSLTIDFGPWGQMDVELGSDYLWLDSANVELAQSMAFYLATNYQGQQFSELACDGGLSIPCLLPAGIDSGEILPLLKSEGIIQFAVASFYMDSSAESGSALLGAVDSTQYCGTLNVVQTIRYNPIPYLWVVNLNSLSCQNKTILSNINFALDTGSSRFKGDANYIQKLISAVTLNGQLPSTQPLGNPDFSQYPPINLNINGVNYELTPRHYFIPKDESVLELAFHVMDGLEGLLLVGSVFLETVYSVFYYETLVAGVQAIGLGKRSNH